MLGPARTESAEEYKIGEEVKLNGHIALVVRIVDQVALFEIPLRRYIVDELYVELLTDQGETAFVSIRRKVHDIERPPGNTLRGPEPIMKMAEDRI